MKKFKFTESKPAAKQPSQKDAKSVRSQTHSSQAGVKPKQEKQAPIVELIQALSKSREVSSTYTLSEFLQKVGAKPQLRGGSIKEYTDKFVVCTVKDYQPKKLEALKKKEKTFKFKSTFHLILRDIAKELIDEEVPNHMLSYGFKYTTSGDDENEKKFTKLMVNPNHPHFVTPEWESIYLELGDDLYFHFFKHYLIFLKSKEETLVQVSGRNIYSYVLESMGQTTFHEQGAKGKYASFFDETGNPAVSKEQRQDGKSHKFNIKDEQGLYQLTPAASQDVVRHRIFYCTHQNRENKFFRHNVFSNKSLSLEEKVEKVMSTHFGFMRLRRSLKSNLTTILQHVVEKIPTLNFSRLLTEHAPLPFNWAVRKEELLKMAENPLERGKVYAELFEKDNTPTDEVAAFLWAVTREAFPSNFLAGKTNKNAKVLYRKIKEFVTQNRFETFNRVTMMAKFEPNNFQWSQFNASHSKAKFFMRENEFVVWRLLKWAFEEVYVPLIRCYFYVTEKQKESSRVFYYRKNVWNVAMKLSVTDLLKENVQAVSKTEMVDKCKSQNFAPAKLRLVPKKDTFRPIMTFNRKLPDNPQMTTNRKLGIPHLILKLLKTKMYQQSFGYPVFCYDDIMRRYEEFVLKWRAKGKPPLYFVTMDIEKCYDSVHDGKLLDFLQKTDLLDRSYFLLNCLLLKRRNNILSEEEEDELFRTHFRHKYVKLAIDGGSEFPNLNEVIEKENDFNMKRALVVEQENRKTLYKKDQLNPINYIIRNNYITFNKKQYKQTKGIPQGMCISYILSSFYFASLEKQALSFLEKDDGSINCVMRQTDDYLLITDRKQHAMSFISNLVQTSKQNGFKFNMKKLRTNFKLNLKGLSYDPIKRGTNIGGMPQPRQQPPTPIASLEDVVCEKVFHWIGIEIDMETLALTPRAGDLRKEAILATLNTNIQTRQSVQWLKRKLKSFLMNNVTFYFRETLTSRKQAKETLNTLCIQAAEKYVACARLFKTYRQLPEADLTLAQIIYMVVRSFFKYIVCNVRGGTIYKKEDYNNFFIQCLEHFIRALNKQKSYLGGLHKILSAKVKSAKETPLELKLD